MSPDDDPPPGSAGRWQSVAARSALVALAVGVLYAVRPGVVENAARSPRLWLLLAAVLVGAGLLALLVRRVTGRPRVAALASNVVIAVAVVALLAPSFSQRTLDEPLRPQDAAAVAAPPLAPEPSPGQPVDEGPRELSTAPLDGVGHSASGRTALVAVDGAVVLRFEDVDVEGSPGPYVHLVPAGARTPDDGVDLGPLKAERGSFGYPLPPGVDPAGPWTVLVWCRPFATPIAASDHA